jgi:ABC-type transporter Mla maintaining outer membrane lipid asymmetry ATPase subunit MlaF
MCAACNIGAIVGTFGGSGLAEAYLLGVVGGVLAPEDGRAIVAGRGLCPQHAEDVRMMAQGECEAHEERAIRARPR